MILWRNYLNSENCIILENRRDKFIFNYSSFIFNFLTPLINFKTLQTYIKGELVYDYGESKIKHVNFENLNNFNTNKKAVEDFRVESNAKQIRVIECLDGELVTNEIIEKLFSSGAQIWIIAPRQCRPSVLEDHLRNKVSRFMQPNSFLLHAHYWHTRKSESQNMGNTNKLMT